MSTILNKTGVEVQRDLNEGLDNQPKVNTTWDDLVNSLIGRRLSSNQGTVDYNYDENAINFSGNGDITDVNDCVIWNVQKPHSAKDNSTFNLHMHWEQIDNTDREFTIYYRIQDNNNQKTTSWTSLTLSTNANNVFSYTGGTFNQITRLVNVDWSATGISATVQFRMTRSDAVSDSGVLVTFVDGHVERDQAGSRQEFIK